MGCFGRRWVSFSTKSETYVGHQTQNEDRDYAFDPEQKYIEIVDPFSGWGHRVLEK